MDAVQVIATSKCYGRYLQGWCAPGFGAELDNGSVINDTGAHTLLRGSIGVPDLRSRSLASSAGSGSRT